MKTFSIKESFGEAWELWKKHAKVLTIATAIMLGVGIVSDNTDAIILGILLSIISFLIGMGWWKLLIKVMRGEEARVEDLWKHTHLVWRYLGVVILVMLMFIGGLILLVVPGFYFLLKYYFAPVLVLDRNLPVREALRESARMTDGVKWKLLGLLLVVAIVSVAGLILFFVGALVSFPVASLAHLQVYKKLSGASASGEVAESAQVG